MRSKFDEQLNTLNEELTEMGELISVRIVEAIKSFRNKDLVKAKFIMENDYDVNEYEKRIEERALKLLLRQQPVASDLRLISSALKMVTDMERIGDHAVDIAEIVMTIPEITKDKTYDNIMKMADLSIEMLKESLKSFVTGDLSLVDSIREHDDKVDELFNKVRQEVIQEIKGADTSSSAEYAVDILMTAKYLERIGDHAENISEWVEYSITGQHVEHLPHGNKLG
ncbi:phosphate signaling complex protein PhoU [Mediannikoviicoccus vaginalis]|uniref:phosphate signaling complex protein PhoU n=1 Tax=Mediannikoviicoccus vaginalis TaxID=2899727 RepID=UPI001F021693|nr:phosphate signaling complex protein PhoU [Mediannikoviicoccus vaginalis]